MTEQKSFCFMADVHIKARTWTNNMQLSGDAYEALTKLSQSPQLEDTKVLVIGGDWFDNNRPTSVDLELSLCFLRNFEKVYFISGNHDNVTPSFLEVFDTLPSWKVERLSEDIISLDDTEHVYIAGISWVHSADDLKNKVKQIADNFKAQYTSDDVLYIVLHTSFQHLLAFDGAYKLTKEYINEVCSGANIRILVGDIHTRNTTQYGDTPSAYIHSPGSLYPLSFDKTQEEHMVSKINMLTGEITDIPADVRQYHTLEYTDRMDLIAMTSGIVEHNPTGFLKPFLRVVLPTDSDIQITNSEFPEVVIQVVNTSADRAEANRSIRNETYTISQAIEEELADDDPDINDLAQALYASDDPLAEIEGWLKLWNVERVV